jgi:hypothetical protein
MHSIAHYERSTDRTGRPVALVPLDELEDMQDQIDELEAIAAYDEAMAGMKDGASTHYALGMTSRRKMAYKIVLLSPAEKALHKKTSIYRLSQMYHNGRGLTASPLRALAVIQNYGVKRADGTTAARRLFDRFDGCLVLGWWPINVNHLDLAEVGFLQELQGIQIIAFYKQIQPLPVGWPTVFQQFLPEPGSGLLPAAR